MKERVSSLFFFAFGRRRGGRVNGPKGGENGIFRGFWGFSCFTLDSLIRSADSHQPLVAFYGTIFLFPIAQVEGRKNSYYDSWKILYYTLSHLFRFLIVNELFHGTVEMHFKEVFECDEAPSLDDDPLYFPCVFRAFYLWENLGMYYQYRSSWFLNFSSGVFRFFFYDDENYWIDINSLDVWIKLKNLGFQFKYWSIWENEAT